MELDLERSLTCFVLERLELLASLDDFVDIVLHDAHHFVDLLLDLGRFARGGGGRGLVARRGWHSC